MHDVYTQTVIENRKFGRSGEFDPKQELFTCIYFYEYGL